MKAKRRPETGRERRRNADRKRAEVSDERYVTAANEGGTPTGNRKRYLMSGMSLPRTKAKRRPETGRERRWKSNRKQEEVSDERYVTAGNEGGTPTGNGQRYLTSGTSLPRTKVERQPETGRERRWKSNRKQAEVSDERYVTAENKGETPTGNGQRYLMSGTSLPRMKVERRRETGRGF
ncbi:hypothetical protein chiPu_0024480 [Chiloscyllium punctatum]|uniref:Uncharacterized protein n=1 Tax=Chiloscyllium punctatum TaxID=137246 RepID=A0A401TDQ1_CHIPU|nr:hypothetical protein [Chiloscyllium punctatum]